MRYIRNCPHIYCNFANIIDMFLSSFLQTEARIFIVSPLLEAFRIYGFDPRIHEELF